MSSQTDPDRTALKELWNATVLTALVVVPVLGILAITLFDLPSAVTP